MDAETRGGGDPGLPWRGRRGDWAAFYREQGRLIWAWRATRLALARRLVLGLASSGIALALVAWLAPGISVAGPGSVVAAALLLTLANAALRPVLLLVLSPLPVIALQFVGTVVEVALVIAVGHLVPGIRVDGPWNAAFAGIGLSVIIAALSEAMRASDDDSYHGTQVRRLAAREFGHPAPVEPGLLVVQLDGLALPILEAQMRSGRMPTLARLLRSGTHVLDPWHPLLPTSTPASQAGFLHGNNDDVPGFRWYDKATRQLIVANTPEGAEIIERIVSDGHGLLADGGASIGNLVTGDATRSYFTMATIAGNETPGAGDNRRLHGLFITQVNYIRLIVLAFGELMKDLYQRERQRSLAIEPRIRRDLHSALERVLTNVPLRHLTTALVIEEMFSGTQRIFVDYTGYDTLAHHVGPERIEALDALDGLDRTLGSLIRVCRETPRPYRLVVLSDHGQCLAHTFAQRFSAPLDVAVRRLLGEDATSASIRAMPRETEGVGRRLLGELARGPGVRPALARRVAAARRHADQPIDHPSVVVCSSGNLAHIYLTEREGRISVEELEQAHPGLVAGLLALPGVAFVMGRTSRGPIAMGREGSRELSSGLVEGLDPLFGLGPLAASSLCRVDAFPNCGDLTLMGTFDPARREVTSFEDLVGSHGGLGGWQAEPFLLHPVDLAIADTPLIGAVAVHRQLRAWMASLAGSERPAATPAREQPMPTADPEWLPARERETSEGAA